MLSRTAHNEHIKEIVGKQIKGVMVKEADSEPHIQIFLIFSDGTYFEFYGSDTYWTKGVDRGDIEEVRNYMAGKNRKVVHEFYDKTVGK